MRAKEKVAKPRKRTRKKVVKAREEIAISIGENLVRGEELEEHTTTAIKNTR